MTPKNSPKSHAKIGHIHLTVSDLKVSTQFYTKLLGFEISARYGDHAIFLSMGGYHHHIGLNTWAGEGVPPQPRDTAGLYHFAILYPSRQDLALVLRRLMNAGHPIEGAADHGVSEAIYLRDPDDIGVELYVDRPREQWEYNEDGTIQMATNRLDINTLLSELD